MNGMQLGESAALAIGCGLLLAGCGHSPPTRFMALSPLPATHRAAKIRFSPVQLGDVHIPPLLDRPELVTRISPNRDEVNEQDRWVAPLDQLIRRTLAQNLLTRLPAGALVLPGAPAPSGTHAIVVDILRLRTSADGNAEMRASWTVLGASGSHVLLRHILKLDTSAPSGAAGQARAIDQLLARMADDIAHGLATG